MSQSTRALALARRKAMSTAGKGAVSGKSPERTRSDTVSAPSPSAPAQAPAPVARAAAPRTRVVNPPSSGNSTRAAALERRKAMSVAGKRADTSKDRISTGGPKARKAAAMAADEPASAPRKEGSCGCGCKGEGREAVAAAPKRNGKAKAAPRRAKMQNPTRAAALARRQAQSTRGKAGVNSGGVSPAQTARAANPGLSSRELARELRELRSSRGKSAVTQKSGDCSGRRRQRPKSEGSEQGAASDQPWKVGISETTGGQSVTGTMVGRSDDVTGDEPSTCRTITGTEYMGADVFREFCQTEPARTPQRGGVSGTSRDNSVTGNKVGRSEKVTGDEPGTCKRVTGTDYLSPEQSQAFCGTTPDPNPAKVTRVETMKGKGVTGSNVGRSAKVTGDEAGANRSTTGTQYTSPSDIGNAPAKVGKSDTLRGGSVTGTMVGRREKMTGDEAGSCRNITGDDYVGQEQFGDFCEATPAPKDNKVGVSRTVGEEQVTGTMTGRSLKVTGNEPGTCKAITGTPYAGMEQTSTYCEAPQQQEVIQRSRPNQRQAGQPMTGQQPGVGGTLTGAEKGACEPVTGTPYVGSDQMAAACPATAAEPGSADFPQPIGDTPWGGFSVQPPGHASDGERQSKTVTGSSYESSNNITGPFGMASGKVTGTEEKRFGSTERMPAVPETREDLDGRVLSRVTGEGMDAGARITGDDWDRGDRVTGTEGSSASRRNPTRRGGPMNAMEFRKLEPRNEEVPTPVSKVTGSSGNTESGSLITYSGGARG